MHRSTHRKRVPLAANFSHVEVDFRAGIVLMVHQVLDGLHFSGFLVGHGAVDMAEVVDPDWHDQFLPFCDKMRFPEPGRFPNG